MSELTSMMNIGKEMAKKLTFVGIDSSEKLIELGAKQAFLTLIRQKSGDMSAKAELSPDF